MLFACPDGAALAAAPGRPVLFLWLGEAVLGRGVATAALARGAFEGRWQRPHFFMVVGAAMVSLSVLSANIVGFGALLTPWLLACMGANWVNPCRH